MAREHNRRKRYLGRLWQSRYRARLIDSNDYFGQVVAYVHLNPVAAGLVTDPADYALSGHREAIGQMRPQILDSGALLELFGEEDPSLMRRAYLEWVRSVAEAKWLEMGLRDLAVILSKNAGSVSRWLTEAERRQASDPEYRTHLDHLERRVIDLAVQNITM